MTETRQMTKQILDFHKGAFSNWYGVMAAIQDQATSSANTIISQAGWMPEEGRQMILSWVGVCRQESDRYKAFVEESFSGLEDYLAQDMSASRASRGKPARKKKAAVRTKTKKTNSPAKPVQPIQTKKLIDEAPTTPVAIPKQMVIEQNTTAPERKSNPVEK